MPGKQSHNRGQFWKHCDVASNIEDLMKSIVTLKFSLARRRRKISRFCKINMPEKQSHDRERQFRKHSNFASNIEDLMKSIVTFKFSLARHRRKISRFCRINMPEKQFHNRVQFQKHSDFASNNEHLMKSTIKFKSSLARRKRKISRFCKINMPGK